MHSTPPTNPEKASPPPLPSRPYHTTSAPPVAVVAENEESKEAALPPLPPRPEVIGALADNEEANQSESAVKKKECTMEVPLTEVAWSRHHIKKKSCVTAVACSPVPGIFASISSVPTVIGTRSAHSDLNCALLSHEKGGTQIVHKANFAGHAKPLRAICFSKDGSRLATAGHDGFVLLWSVCTYQLIRRFEKGKGQLNAIAMSDDGRYLVTGSEEKEISLYSIDSGDLLQPTLSGSHDGPVRSLAFTADSKILASAGADKRVFLWDSSPTKTLVCKLTQLCGHSNPLRVVKFAPNSEIVVTGSEDKTARIFFSKTLYGQGDDKTPVINNVGFKRPDWTVNFEKSPCVWDIDFTQNSEFFAVALGTKSSNITTKFIALGAIAIVSVSTRAICATVQAHGSCCRTISWCRTGEPMLVSGGADGIVRIFLWPCHDLEMHLKKSKAVDTYKVCGRPLPSDYRPMLFPAHPLDCEEVNLLWKFNDGVVIVENAMTESNAAKGLAPMDSLRKKRDFFSILDEGESQNWTSYKLLTEMQATIVDVQELKLFYTACNAAYKLGHLTLEMRNDLLTRALHAAPETIKFDQKSQVIARLRLILGKARKDGIISEAEGLQIDANLEKANVYADYRFLTLAERVSSIEERVTQVESYAKAIDSKLFTFQSMYHEKIQRMHQVLIIKVFLGIVTLGIASVLVDVAADAMNSFDNVVDFSDVQDVAKVASQDEDVDSWSDLSAVALGVALENWAEAPLEAYVQKNKLNASQASLAGMIRVASMLEDGQNTRSGQEYLHQTSSVSTRSTTIQVSESKLPQPDDLMTLLSITGASGGDLPIDNRFEMAFEQFYDVDLDDYGDDTLELLARFIDKDSSKTIDQLEWATFCRKVRKRGSLSTFFDWLLQVEEREREVPRKFLPSAPLDVPKKRDSEDGDKSC